MRAGNGATVAGLLNLLVPGGGLILEGRIGSGVVIAILFACSANAALATSLLFPDDYTAWAGGLSIGIAMGTYIGAQLRLAQTVRTRRRARAGARRRRALAVVCEQLARGNPDGALQALRTLEEQAQDDLLVQYRKAQVLTAKRDVTAARAAWQGVRRLDRHHIYGRQVRANERTLDAISDDAPSGVTNAGDE